AAVLRSAFANFRVRNRQQRLLLYFVVCVMPPMHTVNQDIQYQNFFQAVQRRLSRQAFETWFRPLRLSRNPTEQVLRISTPNQVVKDWILEKYARTLEESLAESNLGSLRVEWATATTVPPAFDK